MAIVFDFLFKYPPLVFEQGDFTFAASRPMLIGRRGRSRRSPAARWSPTAASRAKDAARDRLVLVGLRLGVARRCCCSACFRPTLILKAAVPQQNFLGVLIDDSRSMTIADRDGQPRSAFVQQQLGRPDSAAAARRCRSASSCGSSASPRRPTASASAGRPEVRRHVDAARPGARARARRAGRPAARRARDGHRRRRHVRRRRSTNRSPSLKARSIPVFTVGVGQERFARDIQVTRVETPRAVAQGHVARRRRRDHADRLRRRRPCRSTSKTRGGSSARRRSRCRADGESATVRVRFTASDAGRAAVPVPRAAAGRRAGHAEQRARRAHRGAATAARRSSTSKASRASR